MPAALAIVLAAAVFWIVGGRNKTPPATPDAPQSMVAQGGEAAPAQVPPSATAVPDTSMGEKILERYLQSAVIAAGPDNSAWIEDGRVTVIGENDFGQCDTQGWEGVVAVALGDNHAMGLTKEGALLFAGDNSQGQCSLDTGGLRAVAIAASSYASYAVLEDGSVKMCGTSSAPPQEVQAQTNVATVAASDSHVVFLHKDGTASVAGKGGADEVPGWSNLVMVACGYDAVVALDAKGAVHVASNASYGQKELDGTQKAASVAAGGNFCLAVLKNGSVVGAGSNSRGQTDVSGWKDVRATACGYMHAAGVKKNGALLFAGVGDKGQLG